MERRKDGEKVGKVDTILNKKFLRSKFECSLEKDGFLEDENGGYLLLADSKTGETLSEMYDAKKLPKGLINLVGSEPESVKENLSRFLITNATLLGSEKFGLFTKRLRIPDELNLWLFRFGPGGRKNLLEELSDVNSEYLRNLPKSNV